MFYIEKVTWIRHRDLHLLTVGKETYTQGKPPTNIIQVPIK